MPRQRAHWPRSWTTSTAAWSLLWKRRLGNLKSSWVTSALLLFSSPFSHPRRPSLSHTQAAGTGRALRRTRRRSLGWVSLVGKPLPVSPPFAATEPPTACLHVRLAHDDQHLSVYQRRAARLFTASIFRLELAFLSYMLIGPPPAASPTTVPRRQ